MSVRPKSTTISILISGYSRSSFDSFGLYCILGRRDADGSSRLLPQVGDGRKLGVDFLEPRLDRAQETLACFSGRHTAGGAGEKPDAEPHLEQADSLAQR